MSSLELHAWLMPEKESGMMENGTDGKSIQEYANKTAIPTMDAGTTAARRMPEGYLLGMVLDLCHELYVSGQENVFWQPENEEHQRRRWLAPKGEAPKPVSKVPKHVAAVSRLASTCAPVQAAPQFVYPISRETSFLGYHPMAYPVYVNNRFLPSRELGMMANSADGRGIQEYACGDSYNGWWYKSSSADG
eukprot:s9240_g3.t1